MYAIRARRALVRNEDLRPNDVILTSGKMWRIWAVRPYTRPGTNVFAVAEIGSNIGIQLEADGYTEILVFE